MNVAEILDWSVALVPVLLMALVFTWLDVFKLMSPWEMIACLLLGMFAALVAWPVSGRMLDTLPMGYSIYSRLVAPWIEEGAQGPRDLAPVPDQPHRLQARRDHQRASPSVPDFSVIENIFYLARFPELTTAVWLVRGLGTAVMHGATMAVLAAIAHELGERSMRRQGVHRFNPLWLVPGYVVASLIHVTLQPFSKPPDGGDGRRLWCSRRSS